MYFTWSCGTSESQVGLATRIFLPGVEPRTYALPYAELRGLACSVNKADGQDGYPPRGDWKVGETMKDGAGEENVAPSAETASAALVAAAVT